jgi:outer membrane protein OmpA-like peptidoglycan-associated protein
MQKFIAFTLLLCISYGVKAQSFEETGSVTITYRDLSLNKKKFKSAYRLHATSLGDGKFILESIGSDKLPTYFKKIKVVSDGKTHVSFSREDAFQFARPRIDSQVSHFIKDTLFFRDKMLKMKLQKTYQRNAERYFEGKHAGNFFKHNWMPLYAVSVDAAESSLTIDAGKTFSKKVRYKTDQLPVGYAPIMPALDTVKCGKLNRFHELRKMKGYGISKFKYVPYRMPSRQAVRQQFEIYFDKNSAEARSESVQAVIGYLRTNNYSILNATIEGYSSVEGDDQRNIRLQQKRARVLLDLLQKHNNEPIARDTVIINAGYELFRQSIRNTSYQWLDSLGNEKIRSTINSNYILLTALEPYLKSQRKAVLKLAVAKHIEAEEVIERFKVDFEKLEKQLDPKFSAGKAPAEVEAEVMGMLAYLFNLVEGGLITSEEAGELLDNSWNKEIVRVLAVYHHIIQFEKKTYRDSMEWDNLSKKYNYNKLFIVAQQNLVTLISNPRNHKQTEKFKQQLVDIQSYCFDYTMMKWISPETLCAYEYPDHPTFRGYKLNHLAFLQFLTKFGNVPCESYRTSESTELVVYNDSWLDIIKTTKENIDTISKSNSSAVSNFVLLASTNNSASHIKDIDAVRYPPSFGKENYSPLLFYLKKLFVKDETSIIPHMKHSDNLIEFDLYTLAKYHVHQWGPFSNYFVDKEVQLIEMDRLIALLKATGSRLCTQAVNQLYLDYHLKALHYINRYFEPGNARQADIAQRSLQFITNYYSKNAGLVTPRLSMYILLQFNAFHWIPGKYDGTWYAWNLLKNIVAKRELSESEMYLYRKYEMHYSLI